MKTNILRSIDARKQPRTHAGIIMIGRRANQCYLMAALNIPMKIEHRGHVRMTATDKHQMPSHFPSLGIDGQACLFLSQLEQPLIKFSTQRSDNRNFYRIAADFATYPPIMIRVFHLFINHQCLLGTC